MHVHETHMALACKTLACYMHVSGIMNGIANSSILLLEISCMKITGFSHMKCAEICMFQVLHFE